MDAKPNENYSRLRQEYLKGIENAKAKIQQWQQFRADYEALQARLHTLPDKLTHDVMVPFGKFAFMPGKMYHTNEVLVLLGDNWFAQRSARQAMDIVERRKQYVANQLENEKKQLLDLEARYAFAGDIDTSLQAHQDIVEIKEEYDPIKEEEWRSVRRQRKRKEDNSNVKTDSELWARLEQLEEEEKDWLVEEERRGVTSELELATSFPEQPESAPPRDTLSPASPPPTPWNIPIFHTSHNVSIDHNSSVLSDSGEEQHARFTNPGDIFKEFSKAEPLTSKDKGEDVKENSNSGTGDFQQRKQDPQLPKPRTVTWDTRLEHHKTGSVRHERGSDRPKQQPVQWQTPAAVPFSGMVVERNTTSSGAQQHQVTQRKTSKFKASKEGK